MGLKFNNSFSISEDDFTKFLSFENSWDTYPKDFDFEGWHKLLTHWLIYWGGVVVALENSILNIDAHYQELENMVALVHQHNNVMPTGFKINMDYTY